jgi:hypothetical protein
MLVGSQQKPSLRTGFIITGFLQDGSFEYTVYIDMKNVSRIARNELGRMWRNYGGLLMEGHYSTICMERLK